MVKKSFYVFLSSLLGVLLFLVLHRIIVFLYVLLLSFDYGAFGFGMSYIELLALDYLTLTLALFGGMWYGTWLGIHWYEKVYEEYSHKGVVHHIASSWWARKKHPLSSLEQKVFAAKEKVEDGLWDLEGLVKPLKPIKSTKTPIKRTLVRKPASRKLRVPKAVTLSQ
jgi:hypothetical protein